MSNGVINFIKNAVTTGSERLFSAARYVGMNIRSYSAFAHITYQAYDMLYVSEIPGLTTITAVVLFHINM